MYKSGEMETFIKKFTFFILTQETFGKSFIKKKWQYIKFICHKIKDGERGV